uniref:Uncharacterized protein n=1 Tax=Phaeomonas parva TaxID=124430 RepID=A0A6U4FJ39_9STRA|mmetsp:Transcript_25675/g.80366  ORF Transcript_25675/g.80366 Transcript_25675/m.80366 type:complete len:121 (+) Transcript_25675:174-536(+)|eukprot:CAMPEP_0118849996 /NCGR_PEP_ID=MMETSP1163-20130328/62_1 /TAXON_ID=124430 /ORGANISM="Phaeomonas parva, Strain CCMP2877" /LENGTH=120 /DNA_ID=CAMNT_0006782191 /DNA_START=80 /DNA_END=442 /DNA_ORIENTATION=+
MAMQHLLALIALAAGASAQCEVCNEDNYYEGDCGIWQQETDRWGDYNFLGICMENVCCASSEDDCCEPDAGPIAGTVIGIVVFIGMCIALCCLLCSCCPVYRNREAKRNNAKNANGADGV